MPRSVVIVSDSANNNESSNSSNYIIDSRSLEKTSLVNMYIYIITPFMVRMERNART